MITHTHSNGGDDGDRDDDDERPQDTVGPKTFAFQMPKAASILARCPRLRDLDVLWMGQKPTWWKMYVVYKSCVYFP